MPYGSLSQRYMEISSLSTNPSFLSHLQATTWFKMCSEWLSGLLFWSVWCVRLSPPPGKSFLFTFYIKWFLVNFSTTEPHFPFGHSGWDLANCAILCPEQNGQELSRWHKPDHWSLTLGTDIWALKEIGPFFHLNHEIRTMDLSILTDFFPATGWECLWSKKEWDYI
jgi:hypothetical protein